MNATKRDILIDDPEGRAAQLHEMLNSTIEEISIADRGAILELVESGVPYHVKQTLTLSVAIVSFVALGGRVIFQDPPR